MGSCLKEEERVIFDASKCTPPAISEYEVTDGTVSVKYTPATLNINQKIAYHMLALVSLDGKTMSKSLTTADKDGVLTVTSSNLGRTLMALGCEEGTVHSLKIVVRASSLKTPEDDAPDSYVESLASVDLDAYEIIVPGGDPYARYTEKSPWGLVGSFNGWGSDPDVEMWTNGTLHVAKAVSLKAGDEVKFRKDAGWDVNFGYAEGVTSYTIGDDFDVTQGGANIVIAEDGVYDLLLDPDGCTAKIIVSVAPQEDPYADYKEVSPWSVIGSFNSWGGDVEMVTNGVLHVCKNITFTAGTEFKFRKDADWGTNFGYADGVDSYELDVEFAVAGNGANIIIAEDGAYDLILDPDNATAKIIKTKAVVVDPYAAYTEESPWSVIGSFNSWGGDVPMVTNGTLHVAKKISLEAGTEWKFRKDKDWAVNFGYADGIDSYVLGEEFAVAGNGANIILTETGVYDFILDPENATAMIIESIAVDGGDTPEPPAPEEKPKMWSLIGTLDGSSWDKDFDMANTSGDIWIIRNVAVTASDEFKIRADHDWTKSVGGTEENAQSTIDPENPYGVFKPTLGVAFEAKDKNIQIGEEGNFDVTFDYANMTILIEKHVAVYSLIGTINGTSWNTDFVMTEKDGVWTSPVVNITGGFKIRYDYSWSPDENVCGVEPGTEVIPGTPVTLVHPGSDITLPEEGDYKVQFTPATMEMIVTAVKYPEQLYMIGEEFGGWDWGSDGVVEMTPVLHNPAWGAEAEGQFYTVRYFSANKGFKFCAQRAWSGDFWGLVNNDGFVEAGGNCTVTEDGFYLVHIDFKNEKVHVEPAKVYGIGDAFGGWDEAVEANLFVAEGNTLTAVAPKAGKLRMYVASQIATSGWWTREFNIIDGAIVPRIMDELSAPDVKAEQVITLNFNEGTGSITGEGAGPSYKNVLSVPGNWSVWSEDAPKLAGNEQGQFAGPLKMAGEGIEFKFIHDGGWIGGVAGEEELTYVLGASDNMSIAAGTYWWNVDLVEGTAKATPITKVGIIGSFNEWSTDVELTAGEDDAFNGEVTLGANAEFKIRFNGNWDLALGGTLDAPTPYADNIKVADAGTYMVTVYLNHGKIILSPKNN